MKIRVGQDEIELDIQADTFIPEDSISLQKEACRVPGIIAKYGELLAELKANVERAKFTLDEVSSFVADDTRKRITEKYTVDRMKEVVTLDDRVKSSKEEYVQTLRNMHAVDNTLRALHKKADIITTLLYQYRQEMKMYGQHV